MKSYLFIILVFATTACLKAQLIQNKASKAKVEQMFALQKKLAASRAGDLFNVFNEKITVEEKEALQFLFAYMPLSDLADYNGSFYLANVRKSLQSITDFNWGKSIPEDVFLHFVLPVRVNNENLDSFRIIMYDELMNRVQGMTMKQAALEINHWCHEKVSYRGTDERTSSPLAIIKTSFGRCGEESTFTVAAMRTAGIPARQVYTPRWAHSDDNHAWVEVWIDGTWFFLGACEPEPDLNMGWFSEPAARAMLVHTRAYGCYFGSEDVITKSDKFSELNLIENYAPVKYFAVQVFDSLGKTVENAKVEYQLYNYAEFFPIAKTYTDKNGVTGITCGLGDLLIWANKGCDFAYEKISVTQTDTLKLTIKNCKKYQAEEIFNMVPPVERLSKEVSETGRLENNKRLQYEDSVRTAYMKTFKDSVWAQNFAEKNSLNIDTVTDLIVKSYGNWREISTFLENTKPVHKKWALCLLTSLSEKDLRDTKAEILSDHLYNSFINSEDLPVSDRELFVNNVLSGRISSEMFLAWRAFLQSKFTNDFSKKAKLNINVISDWIKKNIAIDNISNMHSRAPISPVGVFNLKIADSRSRDIFFVALCRSMGIPSRLNPETLIPQYYSKNKWHTFEFEASDKQEISIGFIHLINKCKEIVPKYYIHFTVAHFKDGVYRTLQFEENRLVDDFPDKIEVDAGDYLLVTGNRISDGSVLCKKTYFTVNKGKTTEVKVEIRNKETKAESWGKLDTAGFSMFNYKNSSHVFLSNTMYKKGILILFLDPDKEPTKHVMKDITSFKETLDKWGGGVLFVLDSNRISKSFSIADYSGLPARSVFVLDSQNKLLTEIEILRKKKLASSYPIVILADKDGNLIYFSEGYKIGIGEEIVKEIHYIIE